MKNEELDKIRVLHDYIGLHDWEVFHATELTACDKAISNHRRMCRGCNRMEWAYRDDETVWYEDRSALATKHVMSIRETRRKNGRA